MLAVSIHWNTTVANQGYKNASNKSFYFVCIEKKELTEKNFWKGIVMPTRVPFVSVASATKEINTP